MLLCHVPQLQAASGGRGGALQAGKLAERLAVAPDRAWTLVQGRWRLGASCMMSLSTRRGPGGPGRGKRARPCWALVGPGEVRRLRLEDQENNWKRPSWAGYQRGATKRAQRPQRWHSALRRLERQGELSNQPPGPGYQRFTWLNLVIWRRAPIPELWALGAAGAAVCRSNLPCNGLCSSPSWRTAPHFGPHWSER